MEKGVGPTGLKKIAFPSDNTLVADQIRDKNARFPVPGLKFGVPLYGHPDSRKSMGSVKVFI